MDFYNQKWTLWFTKTSTWAITICNCTFYSEDIKNVSITWRKHEDYHKKQWKKYWYVGFLFLYVFEFILHGYKNNRFEIEARNAEQK